MTFPDHFNYRAVRNSALLFCVVAATAACDNSSPSDLQSDQQSAGSIEASSDSTQMIAGEASQARGRFTRWRRWSPPPPPTPDTTTVQPPVQPEPTPDAVLTGFHISPLLVEVAVGGTTQFTATSTWSDGVARTHTVTYSSAGGQIGADGRFTAGTVPGRFAVNAICGCGGSGSAEVIVLAPQPVLRQILLEPATLRISSGASAQFSVEGVMSDGSESAPSVTYSATGGTISPGGVFTAGSTAGNFRVIARVAGGTLADTTVVTIEALQPGTLNSLAEINSDMSNPHEARAHGIPADWDWALRPRMGAGNEPGGDYRALIGWGHLYEAIEGSSSTNTRVQIRDVRTYVLSRSTGQWTLVQNTIPVAGAAYREDFVADANHVADIRTLSDGSVSVTAGGGYNFHFWPTTGRVTIDPFDIAGIFVTARARLIVADSSRPDDRANARFVLGMGADYWHGLTTQWSQWQTNKDAAIGRFKYVRNEWRAFNMTTLSASDLLRTPPPIQ